MLTLKHTSDPQVNFDEVIEGALFGQWFVDQVLWTVVVFCSQFRQRSC
jgi:uncharacterized membrane protein